MSRHIDLAPILGDAATPDSTAPPPRMLRIREMPGWSVPRELFGLKKNPREQTNLIDTMEWVQQTGRLKQELEGFKNKTGYRFLTRR